MVSHSPLRAEVFGLQWQVLGGHREILCRALLHPMIAFVAFDAKQVALVVGSMTFAECVVFQTLSSCKAICACCSEDDFVLLGVALPNFVQIGLRGFLEDIGSEALRH